MKWYTARNGQRQGPFDDATIHELARRGELKPHDLVWHSGEPAWHEAQSVPGLLPPPALEEPPALPNEPTGMRASQPAEPELQLAPDPASPDTGPSAGHARPGVPDNVETPRGAGFRVNEHPQPSPPPKRNYFRRHWDGDLTLPITYWVNGFLGSLLVLGVVGAAGTLDWTESPARAAAAYVGALLFGIGVSIWQLVGVWRSAEKHSRRGGSAGWARAAQAAVVLGVLRMMFDLSQTAVPQLQEVLTIVTGDKDLAGHTLRVLREDTELEISGPISFGMTPEIEAVLDAHPSIKLVHLTSIGGRVEEAKKIARLLKARGLSTYVSSECTSACTLVFLGGERRLLNRNARMGFHRFDFPGQDFAAQASMRREGIDFYAAQGVDRKFAERVFDTPATAVWYPTVAELQAAGVVTALADETDVALSGLNSKDMASFEQELLKVDLIAALRETEPEAYRQVITSMREGYARGQTILEVRQKFMPQLSDIYMKRLPYADDEAVISLTRVAVEELQALRKLGGSSCRDYLFPTSDAGARASLLVPLELRAKESAIGARVLRTAAVGVYKPQPGAIFDGQLERLATKLVDQGFDAEAFAAMSDPAAKVDPERVCDLVIALYTLTLERPRTEAGQFLRTLYASE